MAKDKGRLTPFVPLLRDTMATPAWRATSHGAKVLYIAMKARVPKERNEVYLSHRDASAELGSGRTKITEWFAELEHYGFIVMTSPGCLGVDGKGKATHWRLTELGATTRASANGAFQPPTADFRKWQGELFDPKPYRRASKWLETESRPSRSSQGGLHVRATPGLHGKAT